MKDKVEAIEKVPSPTSADQVHTFIGMVNYYHKFVPNVSTILHPLYHLIKKDTEFVWNTTCETAFQRIKAELVSAKVLVHYNPKLPLVLATDASPYGLGVVLSHIMPDQSERPIAFGSRTLTKSEANYSQIDKEATAIFWGLKRYFQFCYGRKFTLITDHQALTSIFHPTKSLPVLSATRMLHYAQFLSGFNYDIRYRKTGDHKNADFLSRFPLHTTDNAVDEVTCFQIRQIETLPIAKKQLQTETRNDPELCEMYNSLISGITKSEIHQKFSLHDGCLMNGIRVVIPKLLQKQVLHELHTGHMGISKMKALARSYCYWKGIDFDIENLVKSCKSCCNTQNNVSKIQSHPWDFPNKPWERVHIDYAGPFMEYSFLIVVDAHSKWPEIIPTKPTNSTATIKILREIFSRFGLPSILVSDNGSNFRSSEFEDFLKANGIHHKYSAPYHPATNGQAERFVQIMKQSLRAMENEPGDITLKLSRFLMQYRITPHTTTKRSPAELMFGRKIRSRLDIMRSNIQQEMNLNNFETPKKTPSYVPGQPVQIRFYNGPCKWKFGTVVCQKGQLNYAVLVDRTEHIRHVSQMRSTGYTGSNDNNFSNIETDIIITSQQNQQPSPEPSPNADIAPTITSRRSVYDPPLIIAETQQPTKRRSIAPPAAQPPISPKSLTLQPPMDSSETLRKSERVRRKPARYLQ
jgi:hypothetical protein